MEIGHVLWRSLKNSFPNRQLLYSIDALLGAKALTLQMDMSSKANANSKQQHVFGSTVSLSSIQEQIIFKSFPLKVDNLSDKKLKHVS